MSPFFRQSNIEKYTPKTLKFSQLYAHNVGVTGDVDNSVKSKAKNALAQAGISQDEITKIISHDQPISVSQMKAVAALLSGSKIYGFEKNQHLAIKDLLNKERVKAQSIANIRKEHIIEAMDEEMPAIGTTSLSGRDISPNKPLPKPKSRSTFNLGQQAAKPTGSLSANAKTAGSSRPSSGSYLKPKF